MFAKEACYTTEILLAVTTPFAVLAAGPRQNLGTLTCSGKADPARVRSLNCTFAPIDGATAKFHGEIAQIGATPNASTKRVLIWSVLGPAELSPSDLEGKFTRRATQAAPDHGIASPLLIGGAEDAIALAPPNGHKQIPGNPVLTILELELRALKV